jgi:predicted extracellular nuclease
MLAVWPRSALGRLALSLATVLSVAAPHATPTLAISNDVVISQIYGGGGNSGATLTNDFVELFNRGATEVDLAGWTVQYASAAGNSWQRTNLVGTLAAGHYYLVQEAAGAGGTSALPTPDASGAINMSGTSGKVALVTTTTALTCGGATPCLPNATIRDFVGYGASATTFEGIGPTGTLSNTTAALRNQLGCAETDQNSADFSVGAPAPRNTVSQPHFCFGDQAPSVASSSPADGGVDAPIDSNLSLTFSEPVNTTADWFSTTCSSSGTHAATASGGPTTFTLDPAIDFAFGETCTLTIRASQVTDQDANDPPDNMANDAVISFSVVGHAARIHDIQGASHISPFVGQRVASVPGIVTALRTNGLYLQDPNPDALEATSEGIFVFTSSAPSVSVGDSLLVNGSVTEFRPGGASTANLTTTELGSPVISLVSHATPLPAPIVIGQGGRIPPTVIIEDDASTGNVETGGVFDPATDGIDFYESLEGMLVQINNPVIVGPTNTFNEIPVLADNGANASVRTGNGGILARSSDFNPERIIVDDEILKLSGKTIPPVNVADRFNGALVGVVDYNFGNFMVELTDAPTVTPHNLQKEVTNSGIPNQLKVATFNVQNLDPSDGPAKFNALAGLIVKNLRAPDLVALEEVQDSNGAVDDGTVEPSQTMALLISAIQAAGGPRYDYRQINPVNDQDGGEPGGNIRVVFMFRTDRGLSFVDRPGGGSSNAVGVVSGVDGPQLTFSPGRIDPTNSAFNTSRKPLAGEFIYNSHHLFVVANHFNSKGGDEPLFGRFQPPHRISEVQRHQQAQIVHDFVGSILGFDAHADVVVLGDLNDFDFSDTLSILKAGVLNELMETLPPNERYTYDFEGNSQSLDHMLVSDHLLRLTGPEYDIVHVNAEFADQSSDHDPQVARLTLPSFDSLCVLVQQYSTSSKVADHLCAELSRAAADAAAGRLRAKDVALINFAREVIRQVPEAFTGEQAAILLRLVIFL